MKKKICTLVLMVIYAFSINAQTAEERSSFVLIEDPFKKDLDSLYYNRQTASTVLIVSTALIAIGAAASTTFKTLNGMGRISPDVAFVGDIASTGTLLACAAVDVFALWAWIENSDKYLEMLRLQSQYNNLISEPWN